MKNPAFREWVRLSIPLMLGVSLVSADDWILRYFASGAAGDITRLNYAKRLFAVPIAVLGQATSQASLPFFAKLFGEKRMQEFVRNRERLHLPDRRQLAAGDQHCMMAASLPLIDLVYRRGHFTVSDSQETALYFFWFSLSLAVLGGARALLARLLRRRQYTHAHGCEHPDHLGFIPMYRLFFELSRVGLAIASDLGIVANTLAPAFLLHRRNLVSLVEFPWKEFSKTVLVAAGAGGISWAVVRTIALRGSRASDLESLALSTVTWAAACAAGLWLLRSDLPQALRRQRRPTTGSESPKPLPDVAQMES